MGLMNKLKNILFEEEEVEIPIIDKKKKEKKEEPIYKEMPKKEVPPAVSPQKEIKTSFYDDLEPVIKEEKKLEDQNQELRSRSEKISERELFTSEKTFNFPDFDEEEFENIAPRRPQNILEKEKTLPKKEKVEYKRVEEKPKEEKVKFKPSPIISPVYGILDKNYTPDEITSRPDSGLSRKLDVDSVRKKAFGEKKEPEKETSKSKTPEISIEKTSDDLILEEKLEKARTIDELLKDSSDDVIDLNLKDEPSDNFEVEEAIDYSKELDMTPDASEEDAVISLEHLDKKEEPDDSLESDLFDLIDSMYENREEGE